MSGVDTCPHCARHRAEVETLRSLLFGYVEAVLGWQGAQYRSPDEIAFGAAVRTMFAQMVQMVRGATLR